MNGGENSSQSAGRRLCRTARQQGRVVGARIEPEAAVARARRHSGHERFAVKTTQLPRLL